MIIQYQQEAIELERMEAELLARLHSTQAIERQAFEELEQAMISASMPKKDRLQIIQEMNNEGVEMGGESKLQDRYSRQGSKTGGA